MAAAAAAAKLEAPAEVSVPAECRPCPDAPDGPAAEEAALANVPHLGPSASYFY